MGHLTFPLRHSHRNNLQKCDESIVYYARYNTDSCHFEKIQPIHFSTFSRLLFISIDQFFRSCDVAFDVGYYVMSAVNEVVSCRVHKPKEVQRTTFPWVFIASKSYSS